MKSTPLNKVVKKIVLFSFVGFSSLPAFSQQYFLSTSSPMTKGAVIVPTDFSSPAHHLVTPSLMLIRQSGFQSSLNAPYSFTYEAGLIDTRIDVLGEQIAAIDGDYEEFANTSSNVGVDLGLVWVSNNLVAGLALTDINEPEYEYGSLDAITHACMNLSGILLESCFVTQDAIVQGSINASEVYVANAQATLLASTWFGDDVTWGFHTSIDLNDKNDAVGDIYQWANAGASVQFNNWLVPELRVGYTKNLAGTELSYYSVGITFFKKAVLDVGWSDEIVANNESNAARSAYFSFAIQTKF